MSEYCTESKILQSEEIIPLFLRQSSQKSVFQSESNAQVLVHILHIDSCCESFCLDLRGNSFSYVYIDLIFQISSYLAFGIVHSTIHLVESSSYYIFFKGTVLSSLEKDLKCINICFVCSLELLGSRKLFDHILNGLVHKS